MRKRKDLLWYLGFAFFLTILLIFCGCNDFQIFDSEVTIVKANGRVRKVEVTLPNSKEHSIHNYDREQMESLIIQIKSILVDLEYARDQMEVIEPLLTDEDSYKILED